MIENFRKINFSLVVLGTVFLLSFVTDWYYQLVIILMVTLVLTMLDNLGKGVVLREIIAMHICFVCLVMPLIGYTFFSKADRLARIFIKYMPVTIDVYFGYALPAVSGFVLALCWPIGTRNYSDKGQYVRQVIDRGKLLLERKPMVGTYLLIIGTVMFWVAKFLPPSVQFAFELLFFAAFAGFLYVFYQQKFKYRRVVLGFFTLFIVTIALSSGIFTVIAYMSLTLFSFFFLGRKAKLWKKVLIFLIGVCVLVLIQSVKPAYRTLTWNKNYEGDKGMLFITLIADKIQNPKFNSADDFFQIYIRANQGYNVALVMRRFPKQHPFDEGGNLATSLAASIVPRFLWPDKPEAGGKFNMYYYAGMTIVGWSTNVGPLGEAYGSFGKDGAIFFMILLGAFIRWAYKRVFSISRKVPLLIFWIPVLFYQVTYAAETDTLQILNSLFKSTFLVWILYRLAPQLFGMEKRKNFIRRSPPGNPALN